MTAEKIIEIVSKYYGIWILSILWGGRRKDIMNARHVTTYFYREFKIGNDEKIAWLIGKDRCSVIHSIKAVNNRIDTEKEYRKKIEEIRECILMNWPPAAQIAEMMFMENDY
jgi:chromosomal replication initiation ATPase DnaA